MFAFIAQNLPTIIISAVVLAVAGLAVFKLVSDRKKGKSACGSSCSECPSSGMCHGAHGASDGGAT